MYGVPGKAYLGAARLQPSPDFDDLELFTGTLVIPNGGARLDGVVLRFLSLPAPKNRLEVQSIVLAISGESPSTARTAR